MGPRLLALGLGAAHDAVAVAHVHKGIPLAVDLRAHNNVSPAPKRRAHAVAQTPSRASYGYKAERASPT